MDFTINSVQVIAVPSAIEEAERWASAEGIHFWRLDLTGVHSKTALLDAVGKGLSLPDYFGPNWDSLEECLRDFDEGRGWLIIFEHADDLLSLPQQDLATFGSILSEVAEFWRGEKRLFAVLFIGSTSLNDALSSALGRSMR